MPCGKPYKFLRRAAPKGVPSLGVEVDTEAEDSEVMDEAWSCLLGGWDPTWAMKKGPLVVMGI